MNNSLNLVGVIKSLLRWRKPIAGIVVLAAIISVIVALLLPDYYESKSVFFPSNPSTTDRSMLFSESGGDRFIDYFGTKNDVNRVLTIAQSSPLIDFVINHYRLYEHYDIDTTSKLWRYKTKRKFMANYKALKTELGAIEISVMDRDPQLGAEIVNMLVSKIDEISKQMVQENKTKIVGIFRDKILEKDAQVQVLSDSIAQMVKRHEIRSTSNSEGDLVNVSGNDPRAVQTFRVLSASHNSALQELNTLRKLYDQYEVSTRENTSSVFLLEVAYPGDKKVKPVRWLICVSVTLTAFFVAVLGALLLEQYKLLKAALADE